MKMKFFTEEEIELFRTNPPNEIFHGDTIDKLENGHYISYRNNMSLDDPLSIHHMITYMKNDLYTHDNSFAVGLKEALKKQQFNKEMSDIINE